MKNQDIIIKADEIIKKSTGMNTYCVLALIDPDVKREMWYEGLKNHFSGPDDPNYCVLRFKTERYNLMIDWKEVKGSL